MREYKDFRNIPEEEEVLVCGFDSHQIMESKMKETENCNRNKVFEKVKNMGQKAVNTQWVITGKVKEGKTVCKARLVVRGKRKGCGR